MWCRKAEEDDVASHGESLSIADQAAAWSARCDGRPLDDAEQARLNAWLAQDPRHLGAFVRAQAIMKRLDRAASLGENYDPRHFVPQPRHDHKVDAGRRRMLGLAGAGIAASVVAAVAGIGWLREQGQRYATSLGEVLRIPLADGSTVTLNSGTEIRVEFSHNRRLVRLLRGEALFDVASDILRPFVVQAAQARAVAVGTSFTVRRGHDALVEVLVNEGRVDFIADVTAAVIDPVRLAADMLVRVDFADHVQVAKLEPMEVTRRMAWRDGMISFNGDTLAEAASKFRQYNPVQIVIRDPEVANRRVVGLFSANDPVGFAQSVALSMHLRVERKGNKVLLLPAAKTAR